MRQCPRCGWQVTEGALVCPTCGAALTTGDSPEATASPTSATVSENVSGDTPTLPGQPSVAIGAWPGAVPQGFTAYPAPPTMPGYGAQPGYPYPAPGGYPPYPGYGPYPGYSPYPGYPGQPSAAYLPPAPKRHTGVIVLVVALVALLLIACGGAAVLALNAAAFGPSAATSAFPAANATATTQAANSVIFTDPLTSNANGWANDTHCTFKSDGYHVHDGYICIAPVGTLYDATVQVQAELLAGQGNQAYGLVFRLASHGNDYHFGIDGYGHWVFYKCVNDTCANIIDWTANSAIHAGVRSSNTLKVTMKGSQFDFYANGTHLGSATDSTFTGGRVGITGVSGTSSDVLYTNMLITQVQQ